MLNRLKELRQAAGMSQQDMAKRLNTTAVTIGRYEREPQRVSIPILFDLARVLGVPPSALITDGEVVTGSTVAGVNILGTDTNLLLDRGLVSSLGEPAHIKACRVEDDAMAPTLPQNTLVLSSECHKVVADGIYVLRDGARYLVRRVLMELGGALRVVGDSPIYQAGMTTQPDAIEVVGRVVWMSRAL